MMEENKRTNLNTILNNEKISIEEKKYLIALNNYVKKINKIKDYKKVEEIAYNNKNDFQKAVFELERITRHINQKKVVDNIDEIKRELSIIALSIKMQKTSKKEDYNEILKSILRIEITLGMKIGLLSEVKDLFTDDINRFYNLITKENTDEYNDFEEDDEKIKKNKKVYK